MSLGSDANIKRKQRKKGTKMTGDENAKFDRHDTDESDERRERESNNKGDIFHSIQLPIVFIEFGGVHQRHNSYAQFPNTDYNHINKSTP